MNWELVEDPADLSNRAAARLFDSLSQKPTIVLGLPTGRTPEGMYRRVVEQCSRKYHCFKEATTFNLDEYVGIPSSHPRSYRSYMNRCLFDHVDLDHARVHVPDGLAAGIRRQRPELSLEEALQLECQHYEEAIKTAGGLDLTFLGLGTNGHIGFNEPGAPFDSRTRVVDLTEHTRRANAEHFPGEVVPKRAITMGIATILRSRAIVVLASGEKKAEVVRRFSTEAVSEDLPASVLQRHSDVTVILDRAAAAKLRQHRINSLD